MASGKWTCSKCMEDFKGFILKPKDAFKAAKSATLEEALKYYVPILLVYSALMAIFMGALGGLAIPLAGIVIAVYVFIEMIVGGFVGIFVGGLWLHLWVYVFGGRNGLEETLKVPMYAFTPMLITPFIIVIGLLGATLGTAVWWAIIAIVLAVAVWSFILAIIGVKTFHNMGSGMATGACIVSIVIPLLVVLSLVSLLLMFLIPFAAVL